MKIHENFSLKNLNTFGIEAKSKYYATFDSTESLKELLQDNTLQDLPKLILGGGSNMLFTKDFDGIILHNQIQGIKITTENNDEALVEVGAGVLWHELVVFAIDHELGGMENLSLIPGTVGASPMQNIGAYGVEIKDVFHSLQALNLESLETEKFDKAQCKFGYRESIFKKELKGKYVIVEVTFKLTKNTVMNTSYGAIKDTLYEMGIEQPTIQAVSEAVCKIRRSKLPNPAEIGNAGSFFKNPEISKGLFNELKAKHENMPSYPTDNGLVKIPAGWLIEQCGWKGKSLGNYGVHKNQALVLVNYGNAKGQDIFILSEEIKKSVLEKFGIALEIEVNII